MQFALKRFLESAKQPYHVQFEADLPKMEFDGYRAKESAQCDFSAVLTADCAEMKLSFTATVLAQCARCLTDVEETYKIEREYRVKLTELSDPDFELPVNEEGCLDLTELAYQELIFEVPRVLLCSPDCEGLCPICGKKKAAGCCCVPTMAQTEDAPVDARLSILKQLLN